MAPAKREIVTIGLGATGWTIETRGCPAAAQGLADILTGWSPIIRREPPAGAVMASVSRHGQGYRWQGDHPKPLLWQRKPPKTDVHVVADLHDVLFDWFLAERTDHLCLHAAAARMGDGLVVFPCVAQAGKSVLTVALAQAGATVFCDDVLPIAPGGRSGVAFGVAPRLRNPLPRIVTRRFNDFVKKRMGPSDDHWIYACLQPGEIASHGETAPIKAFILLSRQRSGPARLEPAKPSEILSEVIAQNFARDVPALEAFDRLAATVQNSRCHRLSYANPEEAARYLMREFGAEPKPLSKRAAPRATARKSKPKRSKATAIRRSRRSKT